MNNFSSETPKSPEIEKKPLRIIHIEDGKQLRDLIGWELKKFPAVELIASFPSAEEARDYLMKLRSEKQELPDGIVSDNNLGIGKATGIQFAEDLKKLGFEIPVVLFTGDAEQFKSISEERLNRMGLKSIVDKNGFESTENLVGILKSINL